MEENWESLLKQACLLVPPEITSTDAAKIVFSFLRERPRIYVIQVCRGCKRDFQAPKTKDNTKRRVYCAECSSKRKELSRQRDEEQRRIRRAYEDRKIRKIDEGIGTPSQLFWRLHETLTQEDVDELVSLPYIEFLQTDYWARVRNYIYYKRGRRCSLCASTNYLNVHHKTYENHGLEHQHLADLIILCRDCHSKFHYKFYD